MSIKLLVVVDHIGKDIKNGTWEFAYKFAKYASESIDVTIITFRPDNMSELPEYEEEDNLKIYRFDKGKLFIPTIRKISHDIAFVHTTKSFAVYRVSIGLKKKPIISMIQGTSYLERLINVMGKDLKYYALRLFEIYRIATSDALFFASKYMMFNSVRDFAAFRKSTYLPLAVDYPVKKLIISKEEIHIKKMIEDDIKKGYKIIFCIRRIVARTGVLNLVEMMNYIDSPKVKLYIAGTGSHIEELKAKVLECGLSDRIVILGLVSDDAKFWIYSKSYLSIVPTLALEGFCISMLESMNYGCPPVVTPIGGMYEFMVDNGLRSLVSIDTSPKQLAQTVNSLLNDSGLREKLSKICRGTAQRHYYPEIVKNFLQEISYMMEKRDSLINFGK